MNNFICFCLFFCISFQVIADSSASFAIMGITGKALTNVKKRLEEVQQTKPLTDSTPEELRVQVVNALQPYGYLKAQVSVRIINAQNTAIIINPGPLTYISALEIKLSGEGAQNPILQKTINEIPLHIGDPFLMQEYNKAKLSITNTAESLGYLQGTYSKSEVLIKEDNTAQITLIFDTGHLFYFGQVQFNPTTISPELLHRYVPFQYKQTYSTDLVLKLNNDLASSGYFSSVLVKPQITDSSTVPIDVQLQPVPKYSYTLGAGYGTDTGIRGRAGLYIIPVNRRGHKFNAIAQGSFNQNAVQAQYLIPGTNPITDQYNITGNFSNLNYSSGYSNAYLLSLGQQHNLDFYKRSLSINALYESFNYSQQPNNYEFMLYPKAKFTFSKTTNPLFTPTGYTISFTTLGASKALLSKENFAQGLIDVKAAYMIKPIKLRLFGHALQGVTAINDINQLPLSLALLLGGTDNLKAFSFNSIGPGKITSYGGFELQKEVIKNWYAVAFYDVGTVYNPSLKSILYDAGAAIMWVSPIGPIKLGLAQEINRSFQRVGTNPRLVINMGPDL
jgi:translocation and assembly module TamA